MIIVTYMNIRTGEIDTASFERRPGSMMGMTARRGMRTMFGAKWERRYRIVHVSDDAPKEEKPYGAEDEEQ